ncbi:hypothetical protein [Treponema bryantii]|uniref:hypothetical protein n=1 Tax=Treponema bryantii TaxID=163 RepID=UPI0003B3503A|nr:hypothetical protein [Treponema bryantii]
MACFTVPAAEAIITTVAERIIKSKEKKMALSGAVNTKADENETPKISLSTKIGWLNKMLWGGSALLAFEHVWHGEVVPFFPFLTAVKDGEASEMLHEMATAGVCMALLVTAAWGIMVGVVSMIEKKAKNNKSEKLAGGLV